MSGLIEFEIKERLKDVEEDGKIMAEVYIILSFGKNDSLFDNIKKENWVSLNKLKSNLKEIIKICKKYSKKIFFVGNGAVDESKVNPMHWEGFENKDESWSYKNKIIEEYEKEIIEICKNGDVDFIDVTKKFKEVDYRRLLYDGIHPNSEGHKLIFEMIKEFLSEKKIIK